MLHCGSFVKFLLEIDSFVGFISCQNELCFDSKSQWFVYTRLKLDAAFQWNLRCFSFFTGMNYFEALW